jgi:hypothetical protein
MSEIRSQFQEPVPITGETDEPDETKREAKPHVIALQLTTETLGNGLLIRRFRVRIPGAHSAE